MVVKGRAGEMMGGGEKNKDSKAVPGKHGHCFRS